MCIGFYGISSLYVSTLIDVNSTKPIAYINFQRAKQKALAQVYQNGNNIFIVFNSEFEKMKEIHLAKFID